MTGPVYSPDPSQQVDSLPANSCLELDVENLTSKTVSLQNFETGSPEEKIEPTSLQEAAPTVCLAIAEDTFIEGGFDGWKAVLGCALVVGATAGMLVVPYNNASELITGAHSRVEVMMWGTFQAYHSKGLLKGTPDATLSAVSAVQNTLMYILTFITGKLGDKYGYKPFIGSGCLVVFLGQFGAAWCHDLWSIFLTQGVLQGVGCGILLPMIFAIPSQWFRRHRGVATGIVIAGSSFGGAVPSLVVQAMLERLGFHKTLLIYSFVQGATMLVGFCLITTRFPASQAQNRHREIIWVDKQYFKDLTFWSFCISLMLTTFGFMIPFVYISVYTREKLPQTTGQLANLPISIMAFSSAIGRTAVGVMGDRIGFLNIFILVVLASSLCQAVLWNIAANSYAGIMVFSVFWGMTGPCFISLVTPVAVTLYGTHNLATLTGLLSVSYIPGSISGPPLGGVILDGSGRNWHALTAYSGLVQFLGVLSILYARFNRERSVFAKI